MSNWLVEEIRLAYGQINRQKSQILFMYSNKYYCKKWKALSSCWLIILRIAKGISKLQNWDTIIQNHSSLRNASPNSITKTINQVYYDITQGIVIF